MLLHIHEFHLYFTQLWQVSVTTVSMPGGVYLQGGSDTYVANIPRRWMHQPKGYHFTAFATDSSTLMSCCE